MASILHRWGRIALRREASAKRSRKGCRLSGETRLALLVPADSLSLRLQLKDLVEGMQEQEEVSQWCMVVDTGMSRKAHAKARAQRIKSLNQTPESEPEFPQHAQVKLVWKDDVGARGLPKTIPDALHEADVVLWLDQTGDNLPLRAWLKRSTVGFKVGPASAQNGDLDFMLTWPDGGDMSSFVQLAFHYLKTLDLK